MTLPLLNKIIYRLESEGFEIRAIVCDCGNATLIKQLKLREHNYYFENPFDASRKVYVFPDAPHLLKRARNAVLDNGFRIPSADGSSEQFDLTQQDFIDVRNNNLSELNTTFRLSDEVLFCKGSKRQRVRSAAQLLSNTVAQAMIFGKPLSDRAAQARRKAILTINNWFDTVNSCQKHDFPKLSSGFGIEAGAQFRALGEMETLMNDFQIYTKPNKEGKIFPSGKSSFMFWHGIIVHIKSTRALYQDMVVNGPFDYLLMRRVNQDCLENYFSRFRSIGGDNSHPTPVAGMKRVRNLMLIKGAYIVVQNPAVQLEKSENGEREMNCAEQDLLFSSSSNVIVQEPAVELMPDENFFMSSQLVTEDYQVNFIAEKGSQVEVHSNEYEVSVNVEKARRWDTAVQGLSYLMGFIAQHFKKDFPQLGDKTSKLDSESNLREDMQHIRDTTSSPWLFLLSKGGLTVPSEIFLEDGQRFEKLFEEFHGGRGKVDSKPRVIDRFTNLLCLHFGQKYDKRVLAYFSKTRTFIRLRDLNLSLTKSEAEKKNTRDFKQLGQLISIPGVSLEFK